MKNGRIDIGSMRREQIVAAAVAVISEQGLQNLSLSEIEKKAAMSRGQLTYYYAAKEEILLAVFDHLLQQMYQRVAEPDRSPAADDDLHSRLGRVFERVLSRPPISSEFHTLQYTFLSQIGHREDFRRRLATLYEDWRSQLAAALAGAMAGHGAGPSPRALATLIQAQLHGLGIQRAVDPHAYDTEEMVKLCLQVVGTFLESAPALERPGRSR